MLKIKSVECDGIGADIGLVPGDIIISFNGQSARDVIDYYFNMAGEEVTLRVKTTGAELLDIDIEKDYDEDLGLEFDIRARQCGNKCVFCFIDQQPPGMRQTLYVKDDDYRLSFLHGNYITLTNLGNKDTQRIISEGISPLYISIHATDPVVRAQLLGRAGEFDVLARLRHLKEEGISLHGQIVLCPGYNDGNILAKTLEDLAGLDEHLLSLAVVPVGLTKHREGLAKLRPVDKTVARETISLIDKYQNKFLGKYQRRIVFAADEFYLAAQLPIPPADYYEDFAQLENGIGLIRRMLDQSEHLLGIEPTPVAKTSVLLLTGKAAFNTLEIVSARLMQAMVNLEIIVVAVENQFLGKNITVAGLLAGRDILDKAKNYSGNYDLLVVPGVSTRAGCFIDDLTTDLLSTELDKPVFAPEDLEELITILRNEVL